jgi:hypothetical protein
MGRGRFPGLHRMRWPHPAAGSCDARNGRADRTDEATAIATEAPRASSSCRITTPAASSATAAATFRDTTECRGEADVKAAKVERASSVSLIAGVLVLMVVRPSARRSRRLRLSRLPIRRESQEGDSYPEVGEAYYDRDCTHRKRRPGRG